MNSPVLTSAGQAGHLVGITAAQWRLIEQGDIALDRDSVITLAEALLADVPEACREAGYSAPGEYVYVTKAVFLLNFLPAPIVADIAAQIGALYETYVGRGADPPVPASPYHAARHLPQDLQEGLLEMEQNNSRDEVEAIKAEVRAEAQAEEDDGPVM